MIAMIRINLLPAKEGRRVAGGQQVLLLMVMLLIGEIVGLYMWSEQLTTAAAIEMKKSSELEGKIQKLKSIEARVQKKENDKKILEQQNFIFDELRDDQEGPARALLFLSYILSKPDPSDKSVHDEIDHQQYNNWSTSWDPMRVWVTKFSEVDKDVEIIGEAIGHEDVTEFHRRLESSIYFYDVMPDVLQVRQNDDVGTSFVEFKLYCRLNYDMDGIPRPKSEVDASKKGAPHASGAKAGKPGATTQ